MSQPLQQSSANLSRSKMAQMVAQTTFRNSMAAYQQQQRLGGKADYKSTTSLVSDKNAKGKDKALVNTLTEIHAIAGGGAAGAKQHDEQLETTQKWKAAQVWLGNHTQSARGQEMEKTYSQSLMLQDKYLPQNSNRSSQSIQKQQSKSFNQQFGLKKVMSPQLSARGGILDQQLSNKQSQGSLVNSPKFKLISPKFMSSIENQNKKSHKRSQKPSDERPAKLRISRRQRMSKEKNVAPLLVLERSLKASKTNLNLHKKNSKTSNALEQDSVHAHSLATLTNVNDVSHEQPLNSMRSSGRHLKNDHRQLQKENPRNSQVQQVVLPATNTNNSIIDSVDENDIDDISMAFNDPADSAGPLERCGSNGSSSERSHRSQYAKFNRQHTYTNMVGTGPLSSRLSNQEQDPKKQAMLFSSAYDSKRPSGIDISKVISHQKAAGDQPLLSSRSRSKRYNHLKPTQSSTLKMRDTNSSRLTVVTSTGQPMKPLTQMTNAMKSIDNQNNLYSSNPQPIKDNQIEQIINSTDKIEQQNLIENKMPGKNKPINSPKRVQAPQTGYWNNQQAIRKAQVSLDRKSQDKNVPKAGVSKQNSKEVNNFQTLNPHLNKLIKNEIQGHDSTTNLNQQVIKKSQSRDRRSGLGYQSKQGSRLGNRIGESSRTPGKFKQTSYLSSYKKVATTFQQSKQKLNQSLNSVGSNDQKSTTFQAQTKNNYINVKSTGFTNKRTGIHQEREKVAETAQSRQMVNSPFKLNYSKNISQGEHYVSMQNKGAQFGAKTVARKYDKVQRPAATKAEKSLQRQSYAPQNNSYMQFSSNRDKVESNFRNSTSSKSPSKKSLQLQQILKSLNTQSGSQTGSKKRNMSNMAITPQVGSSDNKTACNTVIHELPETNTTNKIVNSHAYTKSFQQEDQVEMGELQDGGVINAPKIDVVQKLEIKAPQTTVAKSINHRNSMNLVAGTSTRTSHVNPYIYQKNKINPTYAATGTVSSTNRRLTTQLGAPGPTQPKKLDTVADVEKESKASAERYHHKRINSNNSSLQLNQHEFQKSSKMTSPPKNVHILSQSIQQKIDNQAKNHYYKRESMPTQSNAIVSPVGLQTDSINNSEIKLNSILTDRSEPGPHRRNKNDRLNSGIAAQKNAKYGGITHKPRISETSKANVSSQNKLGKYSKLNRESNSYLPQSKQYEANANMPAQTRQSKYGNQYIRRFLQNEKSIAEESQVSPLLSASGSGVSGVPPILAGVVDMPPLSKIGSGVERERSNQKMNESSENVEDLQTNHQNIITPKRLSDMNSNASRLLSAGKVAIRKEDEVGNEVATDMNISRNSMPSYTFMSHGLNSNRKETKYMEISFSNDNASMNDAEAEKVSRLSSNAMTPSKYEHATGANKSITPGKLAKAYDNQEMLSKAATPSKIQIYDQQVSSIGVTKKHSLNEVIYENPYNDSQYEDMSTPAEVDKGAEVSAEKNSVKNYSNDTFAADAKDEHQINISHSIGNISKKSNQTNDKHEAFFGVDKSGKKASAAGDALSMLAESKKDESFQGSSSVFKPVRYGRRSEIDMLNQIQAKESDGFPMPVKRFLQNHSHQLLDQELAELKSPDNKFDMIYFPGLVTQRTDEKLEMMKDVNIERCQTFNEKKAEDTQNDTQNGEYQGNPVFDNYEGYYRVQMGDHIAYRFEVMKVLGKGSFAQVVQCRDHLSHDKQIIAVKITRNTEMDHKFAHKEAQYLKYIMQEDPNDKHNIVRMVDQCFFREHHCFVFELLHTDLFEHLKATGFVGFSTDKIRDYAIQILKGLVFLEKHKIIHCDLKPENILCVDTMCRNLKIVDFGSGCFRDEQIYTYVQSRFYRSPEVILRIKYSEKVDIWSLGCILAELYTGEPIFPGNNEQEQLELIMELCGMPPDSMIDKSRKKDHYFDTDYSPFLIEDDDLGILRIPNTRTLKEAVPCEDHDFIDFCMKCLEIDPETRFSASEAMEHPWIRSAFKDPSSKQSKLLSEQVKKIQMQKQTNKRMGQNESQEHLYQPQILRDARQREGDGAHEEPSEVSPERDIVVQRKKQTHQPNKESFGIKLNNLNQSNISNANSSSAEAPSHYSKKHAVGSEKTQKKQVSVSDYIEEQKRSNGSQNFYNYQNSVSFKHKKDQNSNSDDVSGITSLQESSQNSGKSNISLLQEQEQQLQQFKSTFGKKYSQNTKNQYYKIYKNQGGQDNSSAILVNKSKTSIIPEIDFTNKYVANRHASGYGSNTKVDKDSTTGAVNESSNTNGASSGSSPARNKFANHLSQMEQISQFDRDREESKVSESHLSYQNSLGVRDSNSANIATGIPVAGPRKKVMQNNYLLPSQ